MKTIIKYNKFLDPIFKVYTKTLPTFSEWEGPTVEEIKAKAKPAEQEKQESTKIPVYAPAAEEEMGGGCNCGSGGCGSGSGGCGGH